MQSEWSGEGWKRQRGGRMWHCEQPPVNEVHTKLSVNEGGWGRGRGERERNAESESRLCILMPAGGNKAG